MHATSNVCVTKSLKSNIFLEKIQLNSNRIVTNRLQNAEKSKLTAFVKEAEKPEPPVEVLAISEVKQVASNAVNVTFNKDVSKEVTADNLTIVSDDGAARQLAVKSVTFSADGKSAKVVIFGNFTDGTSYKVSYTTLEGTFPASVGAVASVTINTTTAQQNVTTPIDFQLFDANGIDVTPSISLDAYTSVSIGGNYATAEITKPSSAKITLDTIGAVATVTVTYNANTATSVDVSATQDITCVDPKAVDGKTLFAVLDDTTSSKVNAESGCAKFYQGLGDSSAKIAVANDDDYIFFCATDDNGDAISYDSYEVESSNDNMVIASVFDGGKGGTTGKYAIIQARGNNVGAAQLNITATKNGKTSSYIIPVTTYKADVATKMTVEVSRSTMSDAVDADYQSVITAQLYDAADNKVEGTYLAECKTTATTPAVIAIGSKHGEFVVTAADAAAKTYTFEISGSDNVDNSKAITKRVNISVRSLPADLKNVSYQLEVSKSTLDIADKDNRETTVRLYATCNGLFAGYVRDGGFTTIGGKPITNTTTQAIKSVSASAVFGTMTLNVVTGALNATGTAVANPSDSTSSGSGTSTGAVIGLNLKSVDPQAGAVDARPDGGGNVARLGGYTIRFDLVINGKVVSKTAGITVKNSYTQPTVKVLSTKVNTLTINDIIADGHLSTNVDMNNNTSGHESITGLYDANYDDAVVSGTKNDRMTVRYVAVKDNVVNGETWTFYVPVSATFIQE